MKLAVEFYQCSPEIVARDLLGKVLVHDGKELIITETEAYLGPEDLASHARFGQTERTKIMWGDGGFLYVYLIYGVHIMANIITGRIDEPGSVLLRAGIIPATRERVTGPGKFTRYLGITRRDNGGNLTISPTLRIEGRGIQPEKITATPRIGVDYAGDWAKKKLRYVAAF